MNKRKRIRWDALVSLAVAGVLLLAGMLFATDPPSTPPSTAAKTQPVAQPSQRSELFQSKEEADRKSIGCVSCHGPTEAPSMHPSGAVHLACVDCHGGKAEIQRPAGSDPKSQAYKQAAKQAHPRPKLSEMWKGSANPVRANADWLKEDKDYIKFVNPGDLRVASETCGQVGCHVSEVRAVRTGMMTHGGMLWNAALYNNGAVPFKDTRYGESYSPQGLPQSLRAWPPPTAEETRAKGWLSGVGPLPRWEVSQPGNILRVFERGAGPRGEIGNPLKDEDPGKPDDKLSNRGLGTLLRTDPVFLGLQKTRLLDPLLSMPGTNDHPGDYRSSGCTGCHVIYANDRSPLHSGSYSQFGNQGKSAQMDPTIPKNEPGHPIQHVFTRAIPTSQCIVCHIHPGTNMVSTYLGYIWWDNETDGEPMYSKTQHDPTDRERYNSWLANPNGAAARGKWNDLAFLNEVGSADFNKQLKHTQFGDFHSHGWVFRAVYKRDRKGNMLDAEDKPVAHADPEKFNKGVQLRDVHLDKGMHCADCHFSQDNHGDGHIYGETRNAVEVDCVDCHGSIDRKSNLRTSAAAAPAGGTNMELLRTPWGQRRFYRDNGKLYQRSAVEKDKEPWEVVQVMDTITPGNPHYSEKSRLAKTILKDGQTWGAAPGDDSKLAHANSKMTCYACHSSWTTSCFGCHLPMQANKKMPMLHNEGQETRNYTSYNYDVLRDDVYMLGIDGTVTNHRIAPTRSTCAVVVSSQNANRDWLYYQQQTISTEGFSGFGFSTYYPHTVRGKETKTCTDCHVSQKGDNNAWMAQLLMQGTNLVNFMGRYIYLAEGPKGFSAVTVAEHDDPPAIFGSDLHKLVYPRSYEKFVSLKREIEESDHHAGEDVLDLQARGEYLYAAMGKGGFRIFDVANIDNKNFSEKMNTAPVSPLGQRFFVKTKYATSVGSPSTLAVDPLRSHDPRNEEQAIALFYGFLYVTDLYEGLVVIGDPNLKSKSPGVLTLLDGNPNNNFLKKALSFNPNGILDGARRITIAGHYAYILCKRGLVVVDIANPLEPKVTAEIGAPDLVEPQGISVQFRYAFVVDQQGLKVLDTSFLDKPRVVPSALVPLQDARNLYVARTYAYVAGGKQGLVIVDVEQPEHPVLDQVFNEEGKINDTRDVKISMVAASAFAYLADGVNGMKIVQIFAPNDNPNYLGFSPKPTPKLVAEYKSKGPALAISKGIDRDRGVDESGNQLTVFNRRGSRPFTAEEAKRMYVHSGNGQPYTVTNDLLPARLLPRVRDNRESMAESKKRILILGGGFGGVYTASRLEKLLSPQEADICLVNRENYFVYQPMLPEVISGSIGLTDVVSPIRRLCPRTQLVMREVEHIDLEKRVVTVSPGFRPRRLELPYDYLVVALGSVTSFYGMPGMLEHSLPFRTLADAIVLRNRIIHCLEEADVETDVALRRKLVTFVVSGGGFSGVEVIAEVNDFVRAVARSYPRIPPEEIRCVLVHSRERILQEMDEGLALFAQKILAGRGVELKLGDRLVAATSEKAILKSGAEIPSKTIVSTVPSAMPPLLEKLPCAKEKGRLLLDQQLALKGREGQVWAVGDCAFIQTVSGTQAPPTAQHATREANTVATNIAAEIHGGERALFAFEGLGKLGALGHNCAVADVFGIKISGFLAWLLWRTIYLMKLPGLPTKVRVASDWLIALLLPPNMAQLSLASGAGFYEQHFAAGETIFNQGDLGDFVYVIQAGECEVFRATDGEERKLAELKAGDYFGEMAVLADASRNATIRARTAMNVLLIPKGDFDKLKSNVPAFGEVFSALAKKRSAES